ncbi:MAG: abortive infection system antitoxin AbiGi family protein [Limisphaerales bacterium]
MLKILKEGFWPQYSIEDVAWLDAGVPRLAWPMVSFCDIPLSRLHEHTEFYGDYGVGLCREQWRATGLNPLLYVSTDSILRDSLREIVVAARRSPNLRSKTNAMILLAHCKPLEGEAAVNGQKRRRDFYSECEWRVIPWVEGADGGKYGFFLGEDQYRHPEILREANEERRKDGMLEFYADELRYLLLKTRTDVPTLVGFINEGMIDLPTVARDRLKTRIMVLDEVSCDF